MLEYCTKHTMLEYIGLKLLGNLILVCHLKKKLYAIKDSRATIDVVSLASSFSVGIHNTYHAMPKIKKIGI